MGKKLIIINGTMGVGKTTLCRELYKKLDGSVWLDGDWCWMMNPFVVNEENKAMVLDNITHSLRNFLENSTFKYIIFNWVIQYEDIFDTVLSKLSDIDFDLFKITLICSEKALRERMLKDGRNEDGIKKSLGRLPLYDSMSTVKIDTSEKNISETIELILGIIS